MFNLKMPEAIKAALAETDFRIEAKDAIDDEPAQLNVMDDIGDYGVSIGDVSNFLASNKGKPVNVRLNSFGGDAYQGLAIYNALADHDAQVTTTVEGIAYSAASIIFLAGDARRMHEASDFGIHRAWSGAVGNQNTMRAMADWLETLDSHMIDLYEETSKADRETIETLVDGTDGMAGTVFSAKEALAYGFATDMIPSKKKKKSAGHQGRAAAKATTRTKYAQQMAALARGRK